MKLKRFRVILLSCVIVMPLLFGTTTYAQVDEELPNPGITPDIWCGYSLLRVDYFVLKTVSVHYDVAGDINVTGHGI